MKTPLNACCSTDLDFSGIRPTLGAVLAAGILYTATGLLVVVALIKAIV